MRHGASTAIIARKEDRLKSTAEEFNKIFSCPHKQQQCIYHTADVCNVEQLSAAFDFILQRLGKIDVLVNGAAGNFLSLADKITLSAFRKIVEIDCVGTFNCCRMAFDKYMKPAAEQKKKQQNKKKQSDSDSNEDDGFVIINLTMHLNVFAMPGEVHAACGKVGVDTLSRQLSVEWGLYNVRINSVGIGLIDNSIGLEKAGAPVMSDKKLKNSFTQGIPLQRLGNHDEIAESCLFLASPAASYITGTVFMIDGGSQYTAGAYVYPNTIEKLSKL